MKKNNDEKGGRDPELDQLLNPLMSASPTNLDMQKWKRSITAHSTLKTKAPALYPNTKLAWAIQLAAAVFVGVIIGAFAVKNESPFENKSNIVAQISLDDATYERSHDNLD